jgi:hypothetical protein
VDTSEARIESAGGVPGVSIHSLYKWVKAACPSKEEKRGDEIELPVLDSPKAL